MSRQSATATPTRSSSPAASSAATPWAPNPTIAVAITVEHGGYGGSTAAPIARRIFDAWLLGKMPEVEIDAATGAPAAVAAIVPEADLAPEPSFEAVVAGVRTAPRDANGKFPGVTPTVSPAPAASAAPPTEPTP